jgi:N-acetyl-alpha-D-muramate 1-phosphate uridylyltransferase
MKALIFAAGRGERMRPLSDATPKPLLRAGGRCLIEWQIDALVHAGIRELVINTAHRAEAIEQALGDGARYGARILYSREGSRAEDALETLGGIVHALPLLDPQRADAPFIAVSGDIVTDFDYRRLRQAALSLSQGAADVHLVLVPNPPFHPSGDMGLHDGRIDLAAPLATYANIGVFAPRLFHAEAAGRRKLFPWLYQFTAVGRVTGELFDGRWHNVGTPADLAALDALSEQQR